MSSQQQPLIINGWENGMADSPHLGIGLIRNADIESYPGAVKVVKKPVGVFHSITEQTFTADAGTDICTTPANVEANAAVFSGAAVYFTTTGALPAGLAIDTIYFLYRISNTTFKVCTSYKNSAGSSAGTVINITDAGTGVHTIHQVPIGTINWIINDPRANTKFMLGSNGRVWFLFDGNTYAYLLLNSTLDAGSSAVTAASGQGLVLSPFSSTSTNYLFVFRNNKIDVINVYGTTEIETPTWSNAWQTLNSGAGSGNSHHAIVGQDDAIYFCDDRYVGSIIETVGSTFDPATGGTYTFNSQALDLPPQEVAQCLEELGSDLYIGGNNSNKIYPWDRISDSFRIPVPCPEYSIKRMKNIGGALYILAGSWGNVYYSPGTYVKHFKKIPFYVVNNAYAIQTNPITWGGIANINGALIFGLAGQTTGSSGVYRLYPDGRLIHDNTPITGSANVIGLFAKDDFYMMGYSGGADQFTTSQYTTGYPTVIHSPLYKIGNKTQKAAYSKLEVQLADIATTGNIRVGYRRDKKASFTTLATFTIDSASTSYVEEDIGITDLENIQIQVEMQGNAELLEVRLTP